MYNLFYLLGSSYKHFAPAGAMARGFSVVLGGIYDVELPVVPAQNFAGLRNANNSFILQQQGIKKAALFGAAFFMQYY